jgi:hypothetical protein
MKRKEIEMLEAGPVMDALISRKFNIPEREYSTDNGAALILAELVRATIIFPHARYADGEYENSDDTIKVEASVKDWNYGTVSFRGDKLPELICKSSLLAYSEEWDS